MLRRAFVFNIWVIVALVGCTPHPPLGGTRVPATVPPPSTASPAPLASNPPSPTPQSDQQSVADFYHGKTVRIVVGAAAGGGYDIYARLVARYVGRYIPGNPTVVVDDVTGAGGGVAANQVYNAAPRDGTVVAHFVGDLLLKAILGQKELQFDGLAWQQLGAPAISEYVLIVHSNSGFTSFQESLNPGGRQLLIGAVEGFPVSALELLRSVTNANIKIVSGYDGTPKIRIAMEQGEVHGLGPQGWESLLSTSLPELQNGTYRVLIQMSRKKKQGVPQADAPVVYDFVKDPEGQTLVEAAIENPGIYGRPYVFPPGVPPERVQALRAAIQATVKDPEFLAEAQKLRLTVEPIDGPGIERLVQAAAALPAATKARLKTLLLPGQ